MLFHPIFLSSNPLGQTKSNRRVSEFLKFKQNLSYPLLVSPWIDRRILAVIEGRDLAANPTLTNRAARLFQKR